MGKVRYFRWLLVLALLVCSIPTSALAADGGVDQYGQDPNGGIVPLDSRDVQDTAYSVVQPPELVITPDLVAEAEATTRLDLTGEDALAFTSGNTSYWFTVSWSSNDTRLHDYTTWNFYKINGRSDLFYVETKGSAYTHSGYALTRFEPWLKSGTSNARLGDWNPYNQLTPSNGQTVELSLGYDSTYIKTTFNASSQTYNPYAWSTMYSVEWRGYKYPDTTVGNKHLSRWYGGAPYGMRAANCGRGQIVWGNCSNR